MVALNVWPTDGAAGSVATEAKWRKMARAWAPSSVMRGVGGELKPTLAGVNLTIADGAAWIDGHYAELTGPQVLTVTANGLAVIRFDPAANTADLVYRDGVSTPAQSPTGVWEFPLASIVGSALVDVRALATADGALAFPSLAAAKAARPTPPDGLQAHLLDEDSVIIGKGGAWCWWQKMWPFRLGDTEQIVFSGNANVNAATCWSITSLQGRLYTVEMAILLTAAVTGTTAKAAQLQPGWFMATRIDPQISPAHGAGAGSGRAQVSATGAILPTWYAGDNPTASTGGIMYFQLSLPDLRPA